MESIDLEFSFQPTGIAFASGGEVEPTLYCWNSAHHNWDSWTSIDDKFTQQDQWSQWKKICLSIEDKTKLRLDDAAWFQVLVKSPNIVGGRSLSKAGTGSFLLCQMAKEEDEFARELDLTMPTYVDRSTKKPLLKGRLRLRFREKGKITWSSWKFNPTPGPYDRLFVNEKRINLVLSAAVWRNMYPFMEQAETDGAAFRPSTESVRRVHAPIWTNEAGQMPGMWFWVDYSQNNEGAEPYLSQLARIALERYRLKPEQYIQTIREQFSSVRSGEKNITAEFRRAVHVWADMLTIPSTSMPYIGDYTFVPRKGFFTRSAFQRVSIESFHDALRLRGGDCEDLGRLIHFHNSLLEYGRWRDPLLVEMQRISHIYVGMGSLGTVTDPSLVGHKEGPNEGFPIIDSPEDKELESKLGAHMWWEAVPLAKTEKLINRTRPASDPFRLYPQEKRHSWEEDLPHLIGEGTGYLDPVLQPPRNDLERGEKIGHMKAMRSALLRCPGLQKGRFQGTQRMLNDKPAMRYSSFYRRTVQCYTDKFVREGYNVGEFTWAVKAPSRGGLDWTYGVNMRDKLNDDDRDGPIALFPSPGYTDEEISAVRAILRQSPPHARAHLDPTKTDDPSVARLQQAFDDATGGRPRHASAVDEISPHFINIYFHPDDIEERSLCEDVKRNDNIQRVLVKQEFLSGGISNIRLQIFL